MKIWSFVKWQWNKMEFWMKTYLFAMFLIGAGFVGNYEHSKYVAMVGIGILCFWAVKWLIVDEIKSSYEEFKKEQNNLFSTIKNSDSK